jgi:hypothetical protein
MGEWLLSRRDSAIVAIRRAIACSWRAWHGVPGNGRPQKNRPVGYGLILAGAPLTSTFRAFSRRYRFGIPILIEWCRLRFPLAIPESRRDREGRPE